MVMCSCAGMYVKAVANVRRGFVPLCHTPMTVWARVQRPGGGAALVSTHLGLFEGGGSVPVLCVGVCVWPTYCILPTLLFVRVRECPRRLELRFSVYRSTLCGPDVCVLV